MLVGALKAFRSWHRVDSYVNGPLIGRPINIGVVFKGSRTQGRTRIRPSPASLGATRMRPNPDRVPGVLQLNVNRGAGGHRRQPNQPLVGLPPKLGACFRRVPDGVANFRRVKRLHYRLKLATLWTQISNYRSAKNFLFSTPFGLDG
jgi:hypothetical protein